MTNNLYFEIVDNALIGNDVYTYGFGDTRHDVEKKEYALHPRYFKGSIASSGNVEWMGVMTPSYELPFNVLTGASGSPILIFKNGVKVVGVAYGNYKSTFNMEESEEVVEKTDLEKGKVSTRMIYAEYKNFGLAHNEKTIREVLNL